MEFLGPLDKLDFSPPALAILNMVKGALDFPAPMEARASKIASDIIFCCTEKDSDIHVSNVFLPTWDVLIQLVISIPPGHEWHQCLIQALATVRKREGIADKDEPPSFGRWSDLPQLSVRVRDHCEYKPVETDAVSSERLEEWKSFTAFISRLVDSGFSHLIWLALWEIGEALEFTPTNVKALMDCRVWAVTEWILQCPQLLMKEMKPPGGQAERTVAPADTPGPLYGKDLYPWTLERWDFWKRRLTEISKESEALRIEAETRLRIEKALGVMESMS